MTAARKRIGVLCVDDHQLVREGLALIINRQADMAVVGSAGSGEQAVELFRRLSPDITLMDLQLPSMGGVEAIRLIREADPGARVIVLTMYQGDEDIYRALTAGAATYLMKDTLSDDLIRIIRQVHAGEFPVTPDVQARLAESADQLRLTRREVEVIELISDGMRNKEIAVSLGISDDTVHVHVRNILAKLHVKDRAGAVTAAVRRGIIHIR